MHESKLFQLRDLVSDSVGGFIISEKSEAPAIRSFYSLLGNGQTQPGQFPADYVLLYLGSQDLSSGAITPAPSGPVVVATGSSWLASREVSGA